MEIYVYRNGERYGPYLSEDVQAGLNAGTFSKDDLAWRAGLTKWIPLVSLLNFGEYKCDVCGSTVAPAVFRRISQGGWIFFFCLLLICLPIALFGFLMKEEYSVCPSCGSQRVLN
jgi:DNA-directed RNA polymerase subunit RPC12/RpoP